MCRQKKDEPTSAGAENCLKETTLKVANRDLIITLHDAERIKLTVEKYLAKARPKLEPSVPGPDEVFIDCRGTVRMGAWILESSSFSAEPELRLAVRTHNRSIILFERNSWQQNEESGERRRRARTYHRERTAVACSQNLFVQLNAVARRSEGQRSGLIILMTGERRGSKSNVVEYYRTILLRDVVES